jgi:hypothetical protein
MSLDTTFSIVPGYRQYGRVHMLTTTYCLHSVVFPPGGLLILNSENA